MILQSQLDDLQKELYLLAQKIKAFEEKNKLCILSTEIQIDRETGLISIYSHIPLDILKTPTKRKALSELISMAQEENSY